MDTASSSKEKTIVRDFAYAQDDPRFEGTFNEVEAEEDADAGNESDPWSSFEGGGPDAHIGDEEGANGAMWKARAMYDFEAENPTELEFAENDILYITYKQCKGWLVGYKGDQVGLIPENYVEMLD
ncbi:HOG (high osmolarity glycerol) pathway protein [Coemansia sp. Benny D160-2]|nr:HOG (high osmolarity glycerol) pathway protein [Coemansia sp. Benny D160-2]